MVARPHTSGDALLCVFRFRPSSIGTDGARYGSVYPGDLHGLHTTAEPAFESAKEGLMWQQSAGPC
jgi:hypothetical protein